MSATRRRSGVRKAYDDYVTPAWAVDRLVEALGLPGGAWLEPCAGAGNIIAAVNARRSDVRWTAFEIQEKHGDALRSLVPDATVGDFLAVPFEERAWPPLFTACVTNPPYSLAVEFIERARRLAAVTAMLTRVNFLASADRVDLFHEWMPDVYVLPNRPDFTGGGGDGTEYAWLVWNQNRVSGRGSIRVLDTTDKDVRRAAKPRTAEPKRKRKRKRSSEEAAQGE